MGFLKNLFIRLTGTDRLSEQIKGLYYKQESDKQALKMQIDNIQEDSLFMQGQILANLFENRHITRLQDAEFSVFSAFGEDGIIQFLIRKLPGVPKTFIEFGVEAYTEANTRFLLRFNNWKGLIIDGSKANMDLVRNSNLYWRHDLEAVDCFITKDNINEIFLSKGFSGEIGLLSIDIDGNDYWVWKAIDCVRPAIIVAEFNGYFGADRAISVPYKEDFFRTKAHYSNLYFGASLPALEHLAKEKGYSLLGSTKTSYNAFFLRNDLLDFVGLPAFSAKDAFVEPAAREARNPDGSLNFAGADERQQIIKGLPVINVITGEEELL